MYLRSGSSLAHEGRGWPLPGFTEPARRGSTFSRNRSADPTVQVQMLIDVVTLRQFIEPPPRVPPNRSVA